MVTQSSVLSPQSFASGARTLVERYGWWGVFAAMLLQGATLPIANEVTMPLAGWLLIQNVGRSKLLILYAGFVGALGWVVGALIAYTLMAVGGQAVLARLRRRYPSIERALAQSDIWFAKYGAWAAFIARLLPISRTIITLPAGAARTPVVPFAIATFGGAFLWSTFLAALGYAAGSQWDRVKGQLGRWTTPTLIAVLILAAAAYLIAHLRHRKKEPVNHKDTKGHEANN